MIEYHTLRNLLKNDLPSLEQIAAQHQTETAYKALIIKEFMLRQGQSDLRMGMRDFFAFQRARMNQLGFSREPSLVQRA